MVLFSALVAAGLAADLLSKHYAFSHLLADPALPARIQALRQAHPQGLGNADLLHMLRIRREVGWGVKFTLSTNPGVVFGLPLPRPLVALVSVLMIALVLYFFAGTHTGAYGVQSGLALILAGALGNLYDRLLGKVILPAEGLEPIRHQVRDFIDCSEVPLPFGFRYVWIFNVADMLLVVGVSLLLLHWAASHIRRRKPSESRSAR